MHYRQSNKLDIFQSSFLMSSLIFLGEVVEAYRLTGKPLRSIKNLVKFHLMASVPSKPGASALRYSNKGWV